MDILFSTRQPIRLFVAFILLSTLSDVDAADSIHFELPDHRLKAEELAVVVNDKDPLSQRIGQYYVQARGIPEKNLLHVSLAPGNRTLSTKAFSKMRENLLRITPDNIQAYALTWALPYRVSCMSITSAITFGFDKTWCSKKRCASTRRSPYYNYDGTSPFQDLAIRPTISIAANNFEEAKALIDRGIAADGSHPEGTAYLMSTSDKQRNVRARDYLLTKNIMQNWVDTRITKGDALQNRHDVLFYFTGKVRIDHLETLTFLPGAIADHLTSAGGQLDGTVQMSALRWLEAGATGSYGTVVEPCNHLGKFPNPRLLIEHYSHGETLLEAYWKSVQQPGEGLFIGEPLAAPFDGLELSRTATGILLKTRTLKTGYYQLTHSRSPIGPYNNIQIVTVKPHQERFELPVSEPGYYQLVAL
jgi:uncharacterized protein (TIGR03790 family)